MKRLIATIFSFYCLFFLITPNSWAQYEGTGVTATGNPGLSTAGLQDYQAIGINPANIGFSGDRTVQFGLFQGAYSIHSKALTRNDINTAVRSGNAETITPEERQSFAEAFVNEGLSFDIDLLLAGVAIKATDKLSIGLSASLQNSGRVRLNDFASDYYFRGINFENYFTKSTNSNGDTIGVANNPESLYDLVDGTYMTGLSTLPISLGGAYTFDQWSDFNIKAGLTVKYIIGIAMANYDTRKDLSEAVASYPDAAPFGLGGSDGSFSPAGNGFGIDLGVTWEYQDNLTVGLSVTDIGSLSWTENITRLRDVPLDTVEYIGAQNFNFVKQMENSTKGLNLTEEVDETYQHGLPTKVRLGGMYEAMEGLTVAADLIIPVNKAPGNFESVFAGLGATYQLESGFKFSSGFSYFKDNGFSMPLGVGYVFGEEEAYEFSIGTRDVASFLSPNNPTISYSLAFLRFRI